MVVCVEVGVEVCVWWGGRGFGVCDGVLVFSGCVCGGRSGCVCVVGWPWFQCM